MPILSNIYLLYQKEQPILSIRMSVKEQFLSEVIAGSIGKIKTYLGEWADKMTDVPFVAYHHRDKLHLDVEVGFPIVAQLQEKGLIKSKVLPERQVAVCMYQGNYQKMSDIYHRMHAWIEKNNYVVEGPIYEHYYSDAMIPESKHLTKIVIPIRSLNH